MIKRIVLIIAILSSGISCLPAQIPDLNKKIWDYVNSQIGKKVDRGECWDLAYQALTQNNCAWDGKYVFGKKVDPDTDSIYPGDLIQFENVVITYSENGTKFEEMYPHHTAIVYKVLEKQRYEIVHQNFGKFGKKVGISDLDLTRKHSGKLMFYRPVLPSN